MTHRVRLRLLGNILRHPRVIHIRPPSLYLHRLPPDDASSVDAAGCRATERLFLEVRGNDGNLGAALKLNLPSLFCLSTSILPPALSFSLLVDAATGKLR